eukprot:TRINITY_DN17849_c0_g1_i2.p1 TRINITY_DN17849_c0_g1~~TRINITY_DN17849_c0_g1_i2.p1  ORF type:complete len:2813 (-),score=661.09 TRINITY_DN17849_c0_g1_i2:46-7815(-)
MDEDTDHIVSYREFFAFVKQKVDGFIGGDRAQLSAMGVGQRQLELAGAGPAPSAPPALARATSAAPAFASGGGNLLTVPGGGPPMLRRAMSGAGPQPPQQAPAAGPRPPMLLRAISTPAKPASAGGSVGGYPEATAPEGPPQLARARSVAKEDRDAISMKLQDRIARRKRLDEEEQEKIRAEEEEMQIAIEEQHGANPRYVQSDPVCRGAATANFDFQVDYLPKDTFAFGFAEPVSVEGAPGFLQVDKRSFLQVTNLMLSPSSGSETKLNSYGLTMSFMCPSLPSSDPGGGDVRAVRVNVHYAIADIILLYANDTSAEGREHTHEFKLEKGEYLTEIHTYQSEGTGIFKVAFKTSQGRSSESFDGEDVEVIEDLQRKNYSARRGNMISGLKLRIVDGVANLDGVNEKAVGQSGKAEVPSDRLALVSLCRAAGDADLYQTKDVASPKAAAAKGAQQNEAEAPTGCELFVWKSGQIAPEGLQAPEEHLPAVEESALQGRWELSFDGPQPPGSDGAVWQLTLAVDSAGRIQGDGLALRKKKTLSPLDLIRSISGKSANAEDEAEGRNKKDSEGEEEEEEAKEGSEEENGDENSESECGKSSTASKPPCNREDLPEELRPFFDALVEMEGILEDFKGDIGQVIRGWRGLMMRYKEMRHKKALRKLMYKHFDDKGLDSRLERVSDMMYEKDVMDAVQDSDESSDEEGYECSSSSEEDGDEPARPVKKAKGERLAVLRTEGWLTARTLAVDVYTEDPEAAARRERGYDDDDEDYEDARTRQLREEEEAKSRHHFCLDGAVAEERASSTILRGTWRTAAAKAGELGDEGETPQQPEGENEVTCGSWTAVRVVDESARLTGLWRVSIGTQDGSPAYAWTVWLTVRFAVASQSGTVRGVLLEGPDLPDGPRPTVDGRLGGRGVKLNIQGWHGKAILEGQLDRRAGTEGARLRGVWRSVDAAEVSGSFEATRLEFSVTSKLMLPRLTGEDPIVTKMLEGGRITADGLKNKDKPKCSAGHIMSWTNNSSDWYEGDDDWCCSKCDREDDGYRWQCRRCEVDICQKCEKKMVKESPQDDDEKKQVEVAVLDRFKVCSGKWFFEISVDKLGDGALMGWTLENPDNEYNPGENEGSWAYLKTGAMRYNAADQGEKTKEWKSSSTIGLAIDRDAGIVMLSTPEAPEYRTVFEFAAGSIPEGVALLATCSPGEKGLLVINVGQSPFQLQPPEDEGFRPISELVALRKQWRVALPATVESWPVFVEPKRTADGVASLGPKDSFEELGTHEEEDGVRWVRHERGWSPVALEAIPGKVCEGLTALPAVIDALERRSDANGFRHFRFAPTAVRGGGGSEGVHLGQILLRRDGVRVDMSAATATNPDGQYCDSEGPEMAIDGRGGTRWRSSVLSPLVISFERPTLIDSFTFQTALDQEQLDPVEWRFEASNDQTTWQPLHVQDKAYRTPRRRGAEAPWFNVSSKTAKAASSRAWSSGAKVRPNVQHALTMVVDLPRGYFCVWLDGEVALELDDARNPLLRCDGPLSLDPKEGFCLFGRRPLLKKEWGWMMGAQLRRLQVQTRPPDRYNVWALQAPLGVWVCRAKGICRQQGLFTRNPDKVTSCWRCGSTRVRSGMRPPGDADPRRPGMTVFTATSFDELLERRQHIFLAVSADWCGACQALKPAWNALAALLRKRDDITIGILDVDENAVNKKYFPESHIPVIKLLKKNIDPDDGESSQPPTVIAYDGDFELSSLLYFLAQHIGLDLEDVMKSNYEVYAKRLGLDELFVKMRSASQVAMRGSWGIGRIASASKSGLGSWRRLCIFLCSYCLDPEHYDALVSASASTSDLGEEEFWITLLLRRFDEEIKAALEATQPPDPLPFLLREVFLPGARPDCVDVVRKGLAEDGEKESHEKWSQRWSAIARRRAAARADTMAIPMLQRSWVKLRTAIDARAPNRLQLLRDLMQRGLDLDFEGLGSEQPSALWLAAAADDSEVLRFCLAAGADPHILACGLLPIEAAAASGATGSLIVLLRSGAIPARALHFAAFAGQLEALRVLLEFQADPDVRVAGVSPLAVAVALSHTFAAEMLLQAARSPSQCLGKKACESFKVDSQGSALHLAVLTGKIGTCEIFAAGGSLDKFKSLPSLDSAPALVRSTLDPQRLAIMNAVSALTSRGNSLAPTFSSVLDSVTKDKRGAVASGAGCLPPAVLAALLDDPDAVAIASAAAPVPSVPSALMWAQWAGAHGSARRLLDSEATLSNSDLEGLRRLGRARRQADAGQAIAALLLAPDKWDALVPALPGLLKSESWASCLEGVRRRMAWPKAKVASEDLNMSKGWIELALTSGMVAGDDISTSLLSDVSGGPIEYADAEKGGASALAALLGAERFVVLRYLVQREIALGESRALALLPEQLLVLHAVVRYHDVHAQCRLFESLLRGALLALPVASGPCYRSIRSDSDVAGSLVADYRPGSLVSWPMGTAATLDFGLSLHALGADMRRARLAPGVVYKVRRTLSARAIGGEGREILFIGGHLRVAGLYALNGPLLSAEYKLAAQSSPLTTGLESLGSWSAPLELARRPRPLQLPDASHEPLVLVLLDEEEADESHNDEF